MCTANTHEIRFTHTPIEQHGKNGKGKKQMAKIFLSLDIVGPGILALLC